jgi:O-antigen ligase
MALAAMAPGAWVRLLAFAAMTVLIPAITVTQSRGGLLGVIAAIGVIALYKVRSRAIVFGLAACVGLVLFAAMGIGGRQSGGFQELAGSGIDESSYHRILAWRSAINMALANPLSGIGYAGFQDAFYFYTPEWIFKNMAPHSTWFGMLGEGGLTGLVLIVTMLVLSFTSLRRSLATLRARPDDVVSYVITIGLIAAMASFCVAGSFLGHHVSWTPYLLVALAAAVATVAERDPAREQRPGIVAPAAGSRVVPRTPRSPPDRRRPASPAPNPL